MENELNIWTIYDHPRDFPNSFVARRYVVSDGQSFVTNQIMVGPNLKQIREQMEVRGLHRLPRDPRDDPKIVESWI